MVLLLWIFYVFVLSCVCYILCASVYMCFVVTCWERADLLALVCGVFCEFVTFPLVSCVRCGTWLYRFLIFAPLLTFRIACAFFKVSPELSCTDTYIHVDKWYTLLSAPASTACTDMVYSKELERDVTTIAMAKAMLRLKTLAFIPSQKVV